MGKARVIVDQRQAMFAYMLHHPDLARGRVFGADAVRKRQALIEGLAETLNAIGTGVTKTPEKWWKCWQDWRTDVKAKALKIKKYSGGTGGGPGPSPLTELEENLLQFCGVEMVNGVEGVPDPLQAEMQELKAPLTTPPTAIEVVVEEVELDGTEREQSHEVPSSSTRTTGRAKSDPLESSLKRQAIALENLVIEVKSLSASVKTGLEAMANANLAVSNALMAIARAIEQQSVTTIYQGDIE